MIIWNLAIQKYKMIPKPPGTMSHCRYTRVGFGYDFVAEDYKILRVKLINDVNQHHNVEIFSVNSQSRRRIGGIPVPFGRFQLSHRVPVSLNSTI